MKPEEDTFAITATDTTEIQVSMVETNGDKPADQEEQNLEASDKASSPSVHREEAFVDGSEEAKLEVDFDHHENIKTKESSSASSLVSPPHRTVTKVDSDLVEITAIETNEYKSRYRIKRNNEVPEKALSTSVHQQEKTKSSLKGVKLESDPRSHTVSSVDSALDKTATVKSKNNNTKGRSIASGDEATQHIEADPKTEHGATRSVQDTVSIAESDATERQVCSVRWSVLEPAN